MNAIEDRRSIRRFKEGTISKEQIEELIHAANMAPSWKNSQTPRYYVAYTKSGMDTIRKCLPERNANNTINAVALVAVSFKKDRAGFMRNGSPDNEAGNGWGFYDAGLASQNLLLKAQELGFGTLVMGIRDEQVLRKECDIPADEIITAVISIGVPDIHPSAPKRKELNDIITYID